MLVFSNHFVMSKHAETSSTENERKEGQTEGCKSPVMLYIQPSPSTVKIKTYMSDSSVYVHL